jgi:alpha-L-arabinofuranosidase
MKNILTTAGILLLALVSGSCETANSSAGQSPVRITVDNDAVIRNKFPGDLFGFNINHYAFEADFVREREQIPAQVIDGLQPFAGSMYRYPGGLVANRFWWEAAVDSGSGEDDRPPQKKVSHESASPVEFGVNEYFEFVAAVGGKPWYVLNLVGWDDEKMIREMSATEMAASNARLAALRVRQAVDKAPRYYQLGNELDRAEYQWPTEKYIERARLTMEAVKAVDPEARFVAFLRDFDWVYKKDERKGTKSMFQDFIADVLRGLPEVDDISLHFYYDDPGNTRKIKSIERRLMQFQRAIEVATEARNGRTPNVWITEHARGVDLPRGRSMERAHLTGNLSGAISTADFLIAMAQMPAVQGAFLHGLNAGPWQVFDATVRDRDLRPRPVYWAMLLLRSMAYDRTLQTTTTQTKTYGDYLGGYDVRASGFSNESGSELGLWVINRALQELATDVEFANMAGQWVEVRHRFMALPAGEDIEARFMDPVLNTTGTSSCHRFSDAGIVTLTLPAGSVSGIEIRKAAEEDCHAP